MPTIHVEAELYRDELIKAVNQLDSDELTRFVSRSWCSSRSVAPHIVGIRVRIAPADQPRIARRSGPSLPRAHGQA